MSQRRSGKISFWVGVCIFVVSSPFVMIMAFGLMFTNSGAAASCTPEAYSAPQAVMIGSGGSAERYFSQFAAEDRKKREEIAQLIISIGRTRGLSDRSIEIAIGTAIQESQLQNLAYGDAHSLGVFQQQWGMDYGTPEEILDPVHATNVFYDRLERVTDRETRSMKEVAIQVQRPDRKYYDRDWTTERDQVAVEIVMGGDNPPSSTTSKVVAQTKVTFCDNPPSAAGDAVAVSAVSVFLPGSAIGGNDYPWSDTPAGIGSPLGYFNRECVDFVAWRLNKQAGITQAPWKFKGLGFALTWKERLLAQGYIANRTPAVGAVAWLAPYTGDPTISLTGAWGHVMIVSQVNPDGSIVVEQYNGMAEPNDHQYSVVTLPASYLHHLTFIHVADIRQGQQASHPQERATAFAD